MTHVYVADIRYGHSVTRATVTWRAGPGPALDRALAEEGARRLGLRTRPLTLEITAGGRTRTVTLES